MAEYSRVTPTGWEQWDDTADLSRVTPTGWTEIEGASSPPVPEVPQSVQTYRYLHLLIR